MKYLIVTALFALTACGAIESRPLGQPGLYDIRVDIPMDPNAVTFEGDKLCPAGFERLGERVSTEGQFGGRVYTIRCR